MAYLRAMIEMPWVAAMIELVVIILLVKVIWLKKEPNSTDRAGIVLSKGEQAVQSKGSIHKTAGPGKNVQPQRSPPPRVEAVNEARVPPRAISSSLVATPKKLPLLPVKVRVSGWRVCRNTYAKFELQSTAHVKSAWYRYSDFERFRRKLRSRFGPGRIPKLPPKRFLGSSIAENFLKRRQIGLDHFIITLLSDADVARSPITMHFLGLRPAQSPQYAEPSAAVVLSNCINLTPAVPVEPKRRSPKECETDMKPVKPSTHQAGEVGQAVSPIIKKAAQGLCKVLDLLEGLVPEDGGTGKGWECVGKKKTGDIQCFLRGDVPAGLVCSKIIVTVDAPPSATMELMQNPKRRPEYDNLVVSETILEELDCTELSRAMGHEVEHATVRHTKKRSPFPSFVSPRDTVTVVARLAKDDGVKMVAITSIEYAAAPPSKGYIRASIIAGGCFALPVPGVPNQTRFILTTKIDINGAVPPYWLLKRAFSKGEIKRLGRFRKAALDRSKWPACHAAMTRHSSGEPSTR